MRVSSPYIVGLICARGGSKGVPRKNLRTFGGKPLIGWALEVARACPSLDRVIVSTEDPDIADVARSFGAEVPFMRPTELAQDNSPELGVWQHAIRTLASQDNRMPDVIVTVPATAPLRAVEDVENCVKELLRTDADLCITVKPAARNPYFNMVKLQDGWASLVIENRTRIARRQDAPPVFDMATVAYAARCEFVLNATHLFEGRIRATVVPEERAVDIDTELDLAFAEFLLEHQ